MTTSVASRTAALTRDYQYGFSDLLQSRGLTETEAKALIINGFFDQFTKELPMEYAVELNRLITLQMEGSVG